MLSFWKAVSASCSFLFSCHQVPGWSLPQSRALITKNNSGCSQLSSSTAPNALLCGVYICLSVYSSILHPPPTSLVLGARKCTWVGGRLKMIGIARKELTDEALTHSEQARVSKVLWEGLGILSTHTPFCASGVERWWGRSRWRQCLLRRKWGRGAQPERNGVAAWTAHAKTWKGQNHVLQQTGHESGRDFFDCDPGTNRRINQERARVKAMTKYLATFPLSTLTFNFKLIVLVICCYDRQSAHCLSCGQGATSPALWY